MKTKLEIKDMHCASCASSIEQGLEEVDGVQEIKINHSEEIAIVIHDGDVEYSKLVEAVENEGYQVKQEDSEEEKEVDYKDLAVEAWTLNIPILFLMAEMWTSLNLFTDTQLNLLMIIFATPVVFYYGKTTHLSAFNAVKHGNFNMDSLITLGTFSAYSTGLMVFFTDIQN